MAEDKEEKPAGTKGAAQETVQAAERTVEAAEKDEKRAEKASEEKPLERRTSQDFEVGGEEEAWLSGGVNATAAYDQWEDTVDKVRSERQDQLTAEYEEQRAPRTAEHGDG
jgi:hypothetical protein